MNEQLTIFQLFDIGTDADPDLETLPEAEMVQAIESATGLKFEPKNDKYVCKVGRGKLSLHYRRFRIDDHRRFIDVDFMFTTQGWGSPCETLSQAIRYVKRGIEPPEPSAPVEEDSVHQMTIFDLIGVTT